MDQHDRPGPRRADGAAALRGQEGHRRPGPPARAARSSRCWRAATSWSRACRAWPRRWPSRPLAEAIGGEFKRIQFTPDLVPADLVGTRIYNQKTGEFGTSLGPGLHQPAAGRRDQPRAGQGPERAARGDAGAPGDDRPRDASRCPDPFLVLATQNPIETEGTYALPEAQVDRFMMKVLVGYPSDDRGVRDRRADDRRRCRPSQQVLTTDGLLEMQRAADEVYVDPALIEYAVRLATATRTPERARPRRAAALHHVRRQPARLDQPDPHRAGAGLRARPRLRPARGRAGHGARRAAPPPGAVVRGALRRRHQRRPPAARSSTGSPSRSSRCVTMTDVRVSA